MVKLKIILLFLSSIHIVTSEYFIDADLSGPGANNLERRIKRAPLLLKGVNPNECSTPICKGSTSKMLVYMEHSADPCEEFHHLVCGRYKQEHGFSRENFEILEYYLKTKISYTSEKYLQDFKRFYDSCAAYTLDFKFLMNLDFINAPVSSDITDLFVEAILLQAMPFFDIGLVISSSDEKYQFAITIPGITYLRTRTTGWSIFDESAEECSEITQNSIGTKTVDLNELFRKYNDCKKQMVKQYAEDFEQVMKLADKIPENEMYLTDLLELNQKFIESAVIAQTNHTTIFKDVEIKEFNSKFGIIDWKIFFEKITPNKTFTGSEKILLSYPDHHNFVFEQLGKIEKSKLVSMIQEFIHFQLYRNLAHPRHMANKNIYCMNLAHELMPDVVSTILYELNPSKKIFLPTIQTNKMFADLKKSLTESIGESKLDDLSKDKFVKKLKQLSLGLITAGDTNATRDNYKDLKIRLDFPENVVMLLKNYRKFIFGVVESKSSPATLLNFFVSPFSTKPLTFYTSDSIVMHPEVFNKVPSGLPEHIRLAKIGFSIAQNIAKHFDSVGRRFMTDDITTNDAYYNNLVKHTNEIFDKYYANSPLSFHKSLLKFKPVDGDVYVDEIISDNAAFKLVTDYLHKIKIKPKDLPWISSGNISYNHSFFIAFAQEFCDDQSEVSFMKDLFETKLLPLQIKIRNIISNSVFFGNTFQCSEGSSFWLDPSVIRQFPSSPSEDYDDGEGQFEEGQEET